MYLFVSVVYLMIRLRSFLLVFLWVGVEKGGCRAHRVFPGAFYVLADYSIFTDLSSRCFIKWGAVVPADWPAPLARAPNLPFLS